MSLCQHGIIVVLYTPTVAGTTITLFVNVVICLIASCAIIVTVFSFSLSPSDL